VPGLAGKLLAATGAWLTLPSRRHDVAVLKYGTAGHILAWAIWSLREQGLVELQVVTPTAFWARLVSRPLLLRRVRAGTATGLEGELLDLHDRRGEANVSKLCRLRLDDRKPEQHLIEDLDRALATQGYGAVKTIDMPWWNPRATVELDEEGLATLAPLCEGVVRAWLAFEQAEPGLHRRLMKAWRDALPSHGA
jgi:hypothetical protein